ncbi:MAG: thioesterase family protein [Chloroflexota bacterium]
MSLIYDIGHVQFVVKLGASDTIKQIIEALFQEKNSMSIPDGFRYGLPMEVRFRDLDVLGHVNNATYLTYAEQVRICYVRDVCGWSQDWSKLGMILARTEIDYMLPLAFHDQVMSYVRVNRLGGKSFDMQYVITRERDGEVEHAAHVKTIMVSYDYDNDQSISVPDDWREKITAYEPAL